MTPEEWQTARKTWIAAKNSAKKAVTGHHRRLLGWQLLQARANATTAHRRGKAGEVFKPANRTPIKCVFQSRLIR